MQKPTRQEVSDMNGAQLDEALRDVHERMQTASEHLRAVQAAGDTDAKSLDTLVRNQAAIEMLKSREKAIRHAQHRAAVNALQEEASAIRAKLPQMDRARELAEDDAFMVAYEALRFRDEAGHEWHVRREHEVRFLARDSHGPGRILGQIHNAKARLEAVEKELKRLIAQPAVTV